MGGSCDADERVAKKVLVNTVDGTRLRGRPRKRWLDIVGKVTFENWVIVIGKL